MKAPQYLLIPILFAIKSFNGLAQNLPLCSDHLVQQLKKESKKLVDFSAMDCVFKNNEQAFRKIERLMELAGLPMNFTICKLKELENAVAVMDTVGNRHIIYDQEFLQRLDGDNKNFESTTVLAHEIGHHVSSHTLALNNDNYRREYEKFCRAGKSTFDPAKCRQEETKYLSNSRSQELQADRFAGFIMQRFGASVEQLHAAYKKITKEYDDKKSTHPSLEKRLIAVKEGYELALTIPNTALTIEQLQQIKGSKIEFIVDNGDRVARNKLLSKVHYAALFESMDYIRKDTNIGFAQGYRTPLGVERDSIIQYLNGRQNIERIDTDEELFISGNCYYIMQDDPRIQYGPVVGFHVKDKLIKIILFAGNTKPKTIYNVAFDESKISLEEIKMMFVDIYMDGFQKVINSLPPKTKTH